MQVVRDAISMVRDLGAESPVIDRWGVALNVPQFIGGLVFILHPAGWVVLVGNALALLAAGQIHKRRRFSRLSSVVHVLWIPAVPLLAQVLIEAEEFGFFVAWCGYVAVTMAISLVMDVVNVYLYFFTANQSFKTQSP